MHLPEISQRVREYFENGGFSIPADAADDAARIIRDFLGGDSAAGIDDVDSDGFVAACHWADDRFEPVQSDTVVGDRGREVYFPAAAQLMDDGLREELHSAMAPCFPQDFFDVYAAAHELRFGEPFIPKCGGSW